MLKGINWKALNYKESVFRLGARQGYLGSLDPCMKFILSWTVLLRLSSYGPGQREIKRSQCTDCSKAFDSIDRVISKGY